MSSRTDVSKFVSASRAFVSPTANVVSEARAAQATQSTSHKDQVSTSLCISCVPSPSICVAEHGTLQELPTPWAAPIVATQQAESFCSLPEPIVDFNERFQAHSLAVHLTSHMEESVRFLCLNYEERFGSQLRCFLRRFYRRWNPPCDAQPAALRAVLYLHAHEPVAIASLAQSSSRYPCQNESLSW